MMPVPYTRDAIRQIRAGATARELGWSATMYDRVCRDHGIAPCAIAAASPLSPTLIVPARDGDVVRFDPATGEVFAHGIVVALTRVQALIFKTLFEHHAAGRGGCITRREIAAACGDGRTHKNIGMTMKYIDAKLASLRIEIESKNGKGGGFRLRINNQSVASR